MPAAQAGGRRDGLVTHAIDLKVDLVLALELDLLVVDPAGQVDVAVGGDQRGRVQAVESVSPDLGRHRSDIPKRFESPRDGEKGSGRARRVGSGPRPRALRSRG